MLRDKFSQTDWFGVNKLSNAIIFVHIHMLQITHKRQYWREYYGRELALWLNATHGLNSNRRVRQIRELLLKLASDMELQRNDSEVGGIEAKLRRLLVRYSFKVLAFANETKRTPCASFRAQRTEGERAVLLEDKGRSGKLGTKRARAWTLKTSLYEGDAVYDLLDLSEMGALQRLRTCEQCLKWYYARLKTQRFCSFRCQQAKFRGTKEFKERRREYMSRYRNENTSSSRRKDR